MLWLFEEDTEANQGFKNLDVTCLLRFRFLNSSRTILPLSAQTNHSVASRNTQQSKPAKKPVFLKFGTVLSMIITVIAFIIIRREIS